MTPTEAVASYGAAWNETDPGRRADLLASSWADDGVYLDPTGRVEGRDALADHIAGFHSMMAGHTIDTVSGVDEHDGSFRFAWVMRNADGVALEGMDYGELGDDGRITRIVGFFGPFPEPA